MSQWIAQLLSVVESGRPQVGNEDRDTDLPVEQGVLRKPLDFPGWWRRELPRVAGPVVGLQHIAEEVLVLRRRCPDGLPFDRLQAYLLDLPAVDSRSVSEPSAPLTLSSIGPVDLSPWRGTTLKRTFD